VHVLQHYTSGVNRCWIALRCIQCRFILGVGCKFNSDYIYLPGWELIAIAILFQVQCMAIWRYKSIYIPLSTPLIVLVCVPAYHRVVEDRDERREFSCWSLSDVTSSSSSSRCVKEL